ncbi:MAG TPA: exodeoxyribonuclease III [Rhodospirillales bacterium]|jgi:exodeoxyribonuclease-3|nr:exodeoxyribonuclease III [Rhodospirillales bacterium]
MSLTIATWNVNSIRRRLDGLARLVAKADPDVICLQETKVIDGLFPRCQVEALGFSHFLYHGMKGYNGVAILSKLPLASPETKSWSKAMKAPGGGDCRHVCATVDAGGDLGGIEIHCLYIPAGGDIPNAEKNIKFAHKLSFFDAITRFWAERKKRGCHMVVAGDLNVAPLATDVWSHQRLKNVVTHTAIEIDRLDRMREAGAWVDAIRHFVADSEPLFTWWSYRTANWSVADKGRRLDHVWVTPGLKRALKSTVILREARGWPVPSDHVPVIVTLETGS